MAHLRHLDPDNLPGQNALKVPKGQNVGSVGPSDSSDSGSDMMGPGLIDDDLLALDRGTNEDSEGGHLQGFGAGADIGDPLLSDASDSGGTGERASAGKEQDTFAGSDIAPDRIVGPGEAGLGLGLDEAELAEAEYEAKKEEEDEADEDAEDEDDEEDDDEDDEDDEEDMEEVEEEDDEDEDDEDEDDEDDDEEEEDEDDKDE